LHVSAIPEVGQVTPRNIRFGLDCHELCLLGMVLGPHATLLLLDYARRLLMRQFILCSVSDQSW
jgi:hypothetical protein